VWDSHPTSDRPDGSGSKPLDPTELDQAKKWISDPGDQSPEKDDGDSGSERSQAPEKDEMDSGDEHQSHLPEKKKEGEGMEHQCQQHELHHRAKKQRLTCE
jgi:hypothetical protein